METWAANADALEDDAGRGEMDITPLPLYELLTHKGWDTMLQSKPRE